MRDLFHRFRWVDFSRASTRGIVAAGWITFVLGFCYWLVERF